MACKAQFILQYPVNNCMTQQDELSSPVLSAHHFAELESFPKARQFYVCSLDNLPQSTYTIEE